MEGLRRTVRTILSLGHRISSGRGYKKSARESSPSSTEGAWTLSRAPIALTNRVRAEYRAGRAIRDTRMKCRAVAVLVVILTTCILECDHIRHGAQEGAAAGNGTPAKQKTGSRVVLRRQPRRPAGPEADQGRVRRPLLYGPAVQLQAELQPDLSKHRRGSRPSTGLYRHCGSGTITHVPRIGKSSETTTDGTQSSS